MYGSCGRYIPKRAQHERVDQGYTVLKTIWLCRASRLGHPRYDALGDVRFVLGRLRACLQIVQVVAVKEMPVFAPPYYSCSSTFPNAHMCAVLTNLKIMETDVDPVPGGTST